MKNTENTEPKPHKKPVMPDQEKFESDFDFENDEEEINPSKLDREEKDQENGGEEDSGHQPYEFKKSETSPDLIGQGGYGTHAYKAERKVIDVHKLGKDLA